MKKLTMALVAGLLAVGTVGCKKAETNGYASGQLATQVEITNHVNGISGLYFVHMNDYDFNALLSLSKGTAPAACSEVRKGQYVTRNLDWFQYDQGTEIVAIDHSDNHLASLNVCGVNDIATHSTDLNEVSKERLNALLAATNDGMNEAGVYIGVNVVPYGQMSDVGNKGIIDYYPAEGPNADKAQLQTGLLCRLVLDQAHNMQEAKALIKGTPWTDNGMLVKGGFQGHWLIATKDSTCICEFVDGQPVFVDASSINTPELGNIMTNFSNRLGQEEMAQSHGAGYERYMIAYNHYDSVPEGIEGAKEFARLLFYSKMYSVPYDDPAYFWTEWSSNVEGGAAQLREWAEGRGREGAEWDNFVKMYNEYGSTYDWRVRGSYDMDRKGGWWYTAHSSVWNLEDKSLLIDVEERDKWDVEVSFDGKITTMQD